MVSASLSDVRMSLAWPRQEKGKKRVTFFQWENSRKMMANRIHYENFPTTSRGSVSRKRTTYITIDEHEYNLGAMPCHATPRPKTKVINKKNQCEGEYTGSLIRITLHFTDDTTALGTGTSTTTRRRRACAIVLSTNIKKKGGWMEWAQVS